MKELLGITGLVILLIVLIGVGPILTIMSINTLFSLNIFCFRCANMLNSGVKCYVI